MHDALSTSPCPTAWHAISSEEVIALLHSSRNHGLSDDEASRRRAALGPNALPPPHRRGPLQRFLAQFKNVLIYVLLAAAAVTAALGYWVDSAVIAGVVIINAAIGFVQEGKAERALEAIHRLLPFNAQVLRDGQRRAAPAYDLVPGDIVFLASGDKVPADLRLLQVHSLRIDEASLTGESVAAEKGSAPVSASSTIGDRVCLAYSSTLVTYGQATGIVVATGTRTEIGRISAMLADAPDLSTPLLRQLAVFGRWLTGATLLLAIFTFVFGTVVRGYPAADMFLAAVGMAVALVPEGLPAIMTITLAIGVQRMAKRHAIIRRLPAVETLGSVTVVCTDKTGTLTRNEMTVRSVITADAVLDVAGAGYTPCGDFSCKGTRIDVERHAVLREIGQAALLCNDAVLGRSGEEWQLACDPTEGALISFAMKAGLDHDLEQQASPRIDVIRFESERRFMATLHRAADNDQYIDIKGAPESILALCQWQRAEGEDRPFAEQEWQQRMQAAAASGMRLLAVARRRTQAATLGLEAVTSAGFTLLGVLALADPPRDEAIAAVARCRSAGVRVKMITGDHVATALAIGGQLGLHKVTKACTGTEMAAMTAPELAQQVANTDIFARASPEDKLRLVQALQSRGEVVAMTGDGVNDAPALQRADVGIAMGRRGTEAAKEVAEMVLADDNFASFTAAIEEGRGVYDNIRKAVVFILPTNGGEAGMLLVAIMLGVSMPITPVQILWINMVTAVTLSLAIAFEPTENNVMERPPRDPREPLLTAFLVWRIAFVTTLMVCGGIGMFLWELAQGATLAVARSASVNTIVIGEVAYLFNVRRFSASAFSWASLVGNRYVLLAVGLLLLLQMFFTYAPAMQYLFGTAALDAAAWARIVLFGVLLFLIVELEKAWMLRPRQMLGKRARADS